MRRISTGGLFPVGSSLCLILGVSAGVAQAQEPATAHSSTTQTLTVNHPTGGWSQVVSYDYHTNSQVHTTFPARGATTEHDIRIRQYLTTEYAFENWGGAWIYDIDNGMYSGVAFFVQQPLPGLPARPSFPDFGTAGAYRVDDGPVNLIASDLNNDGRQDLITANRGFDGYSGSVLFNSPTTPGTIASISEYSVPGSPATVGAGDFDGINGPDVVWGGFNSNDLQVHMNDGNGLLGAPAVYATSTRPGNLIVEDIDGDGDLDIVKTGQGGLSVHLNNGSGTFSVLFQHNPGELSGAGLSDVDNDGDTDITIGRVSPPALFTYINTKGQSTAVTAFNSTDVVTTDLTASAGTFSHGSKYADFNGDSEIDALVSKEDTGEILFLPGVAGGGFGSPTTLMITGSHLARYYAISDLNTDGSLDFVVVGEGTGTNDMSIFYGNGDGTFSAPQTLSSGGRTLRGVAVAHLNDGTAPDLAVASSDTDEVRIFIR